MNDLFDSLTCGVRFGMTEELTKGRLQTLAVFCCPNGHGQSFVAVFDADKECTDEALRREYRMTPDREAAARP